MNTTKLNSVIEQEDLNLVQLNNKELTNTSGGVHPALVVAGKVALGLGAVGAGVVVGAAAVYAGYKIVEYIAE